MKRLLSLLLIILSVQGFGQTTSKTVYVSIKGSNTNTGELNAPYRTIQFGIDNSSSGDTILVSSGTYIENINYNGKNVVVMSKKGADSTAIHPSNSSVPAVWFADRETSSAKFIGFTVSGGGNVRGSAINSSFS